MHSESSFRGLIARERGRCDRNHHCFSLVVFTVAQTGTAAREYTEQLVNLLLARKRFTDEVGWLGPDEIGALLPETAADGGYRFADHVRYTLASGGHVPDVRVHLYPDTREQDEDDGDGQLYFEGFSPEAASPWRAPADAAHAVGVDAAQDGGNTPPRAHGIESLLASPQPAWKRMLDVSITSLALLLASPVMLLAALMIKLVSRGPVLFRQARVGYLGRHFTCYKFRTMHVDSETGTHRGYFHKLMRSEAPMVKLDAKCDPRIIPFGRLLRLLAIDELPQLFNVLKGDMSLIGPRPCLPYEYEKYRHWHRQRFDALPGLTGLWQVSGKNRTTFAEMMRLDITYERSKSLGLDLWIIAMTIPAIIMQVRDAYER